MDMNNEMSYMMNIMNKMGILMLISGIIALLIKILIAWEWYKIACRKGYDMKRYFVYSFFFGVIGWLMVIALPQKYIYAEMIEEEM